MSGCSLEPESPESMDVDGNGLNIDSLSYDEDGNKLHFTISRKGSWQDFDTFGIKVAAYPSDSPEDPSKLLDREIYPLTEFPVSDSIVPPNASGSLYFAAASFIIKNGDTTFGVIEKKAFAVTGAVALKPGIISGNGDSTSLKTVYFNFGSGFDVSGYEAVAVIDTNINISERNLDSVVFSDTSALSTAALSGTGTECTSDNTLNSIISAGQSLKFTGRIYWDIKESGYERRYVYLKFIGAGGTFSSIYSLNVVPLDFRPSLTLDVNSVAEVNSFNYQSYSLNPTKYNIPSSFESWGLNVSFPSSAHRAAVKDTAYVWLLFRREGASTKNDPAQKYSLNSDTLVYMANGPDEYIYETVAQPIALSSELSQKITIDIASLLEGDVLASKSGKKTIVSLKNVNAAYETSRYSPYAESGDGLLRASALSEITGADSFSDLFPESFTVEGMKTLGSSYVKEPNFINSDSTYMASHVLHKSGMREITVMALFQHSSFSRSKFITNKTGYGTTIGYDCVSPAFKLYKRGYYDVIEEAYNNPFPKSGFEDIYEEFTENPFDISGGASHVSDRLIISVDIMDIAGNGISDFECWIARLPEELTITSTMQIDTLLDPPETTYVADTAVGLDLSWKYYTETSENHVYGEPQIPGKVKIYDLESNSYDIDPYGNVRFISPDMDIFGDWNRDTRIVIDNMSRFRNGAYALWFVTEDEKGNRQLASFGGVCDLGSPEHILYFYLYN
ncbi:MAG: hypothetical protein ACLFQK_03610 [Fibrobacterota bacterium]